MRPFATDGSSSDASRLASASPGAGDRGALEPARFWEPAEGHSSADAMTCDVEDYFQVSAFEHLVPKARWHEFECRLPRNVDRVLQLFSDAGVNGTFFTLGWVAEQFPGLVRRIADEGHEIASHGMRHVRVWSQRPDEFRDDVSRAKMLLEDASGTPVRGYRGASWSLDARAPWAHSILREVGYEYSSSIYPIAHDHYGMPEAPRVPFYVRSADILEIPREQCANRRKKLAGGRRRILRLLPLAASLWLLRQAKRTSRSPAVFYFHPWELDPEQPRMAGAEWKVGFRHYVNLKRTEPRLEVLLRAFAWDRMDRVFCRSGSTAGSAGAPA